MIVPTKKLKDVIEAFGSRQRFCEAVGLDDSYLSRLLARERGATTMTIERVCQYLKWKMDDAWEITEGNGEDESR